MPSTWEDIVTARNRQTVDPQGKPFAAPMTGKPRGLLGDWMANNISNNPIYGNVGPKGLATELRQDSLLGGPGGQAHTPEGMAAMQAQRQRNGRRGNPMEDFLAPAAPAVQQTQAEAQTAVQEKVKDPSTTIGQLHEIQVTAQRKAQTEAHNAIYEDSKAQLEAKGASEEQLKGWAKFADEVDLTTVGMALLASNDGSGNIVSNLGVALMMGREAASLRKSDQAAAESDWRKEQREERKVDIEGQKADSLAAKYDADAQAKAADSITKRLDLEVKQRGQDMSASARILAARISAAGGENAGTPVVNTNTTSTAEAQMALKGIPGLAEEDVKLLAPSLGGRIATDRKMAAKNGVAYDPSMTTGPLLQDLIDQGKIKKQDWNMPFTDPEYEVVW